MLTGKLSNMDYLFKPRSIAFVGATENLGKWGFIIYNNLVAGGFEGDIYPVNPGRESVLGLRAYPSVTDIPGEVDLAVYTIPAEGMLRAIEDSVRKGVKAGVVISAGFKELGDEYADLERRMTEMAREGGMSLVGPNGQGICCPESKLYAWIPINFYPPPGEVGVVSQSGNVQTLLVGDVVSSGFGISRSVSSGNEADLTSQDYIEYLAEDAGTGVILAYIEGLANGRSFIERARKAARKKPVIVYKGGRTDSGVSAARSHTGAMAVNDELFNSACRQAGIIRVDRLEEAGVVAASFLNRPLPRGKRVAIITGGGGLGVIAADGCAARGLTVAKLSDRTLGKIGEYMPSWWVPGNPVDMVAGLRFGIRRPIMEILMESGEVDSIMLLRMGPPSDKLRSPPKKDGGAVDMKKIWEGIEKRQVDISVESFDLMQKYGVPVFIVSNAVQAGGFDLNTLPGDKRTCIYPNIDSCCHAMAAMAEYQSFLQR